MRVMRSLCLLLIAEVWDVPVSFTRMSLVEERHAWQSVVVALIIWVTNPKHIYPGTVDGPEMCFFYTDLRFR